MYVCMYVCVCMYILSIKLVLQHLCTETSPATIQTRLTLPLDPSFSAHASSGHRALHPKRSRWASSIICWGVTTHQPAASWIESPWPSTVYYNPSECIQLPEVSHVPTAASIDCADGISKA